MMQHSGSRREFLTGIAGCGVLAEGLIARAAPASATGIPQRMLGRTGVRVSILGLGGWHFAAGKDENEAIRLVHAAMDEGVNFFDNSWDYHGGRSEEWMGKALAMDGRRQRAFLMTKNCERDYQGSMKNLEDSLRRLRTDYIDLWQFHEIVYDNDPDWVFEKGGIRAAIEARKQGKVRFIGFTGHKDPRIHLKMLSKPFDWDTAQMPVNPMDAWYRSFQREVIPVCLKKKVGVIGMKGLGGSYPQGIIVARAGLSVAECLRYAWSQPISVQVVGITNMQQLREVVELARDFRPMTRQEQQALLDRVREVAGDGRFELFKSTQAFDGGHHRRQHGFETRSPA
ncbi:MAG: aldo/keto reductase [Bryobacterales bacterium]|nr:aldo/keto reductase [Bryobacteraceae bacterium]MDW8130919.1 aldo/keto reductase [Bryobacterales bacterium]